MAFVDPDDERDNVWAWRSFLEWRRARRLLRGVRRPCHRRASSDGGRLRRGRPRRGREAAPGRDGDLVEDRPRRPGGQDITVPGRGRKPPRSSRVPAGSSPGEHLRAWAPCVRLLQRAKRASKCTLSSVAGDGKPGELCSEKYALLAAGRSRTAEKKGEPMSVVALPSSCSLRQRTYARFTARAALRVAPQAVGLGPLYACPPSVPPVELSPAAALLASSWPRL